MSILLQINNLSKSFGPHVILDGVSFSVAERQKIGVIGRNGAGKSTLFRIITGQEKSNAGEVVIFDRTHLGYLQQESDFQENDTVISYLLRESRKEDWQCAKTAAQFELKNELLATRISDLSGGFQMRVKLSLMLLREPNLLLLDEPTNYLDLSTMLLLENFLRGYKGAYLVISHDRRFIKNTCTEILDIENGKAYQYPGHLENYLKFKKEKIVFAEKFNKKQENKKKHLQSFVDRFGAKASLAKQAKSKEKQIARIKTIDIENTLSTVSIKIPEANNKKGLAWRMDELSIGYGKKIVAQNIELDIEKGEHIAVLGDNGQGKSTFLKTLAREISPVSGIFKPNPNLRVSYYAQHITEKLNPKETVESYLERSAGSRHTTEDTYRMAGDFLFRNDDIKKPISVLSGGEKARLCLAGILLQKNDVLLLDEPTNHLDFETAESLAFALAASNATVLFISHDRTFTNIIADRIIEVAAQGVTRFFGNYDEYIEHLEEKFSDYQRNENQTDVNEEKELKRARYEKKKQLQKRLNRLEMNMDKLKTEKADILEYFEKTPMNPTPEKTIRFKELMTEINNLEEEWFAVYQEVSQIE